MAFEPRIHICTRQTAARKMGLNNFSQHIAANAIACANIVNLLGFIQMLNHPLLRIIQRNLEFFLEKNFRRTLGLGLRLNLDSIRHRDRLIVEF